MKFWEVFNLLCEKSKKTPNFVCAELKLSNATATHWKNGTVPRGTTLQKVADYFGVTTDYLLGNSPTMQDENETKVTWDLTEQEKILVKLFRGTTEEGRFEIIAAVMEIIKENEKKVAAENTEYMG